MRRCEQKEDASNPLVCLVSGGAAGLGQAITAELLRRGHTVATFDIVASSPFIEQGLADEATTSRLMFEQADANDHVRLRQFVSAVVERFGRLDALVNNVGVAVEGLLALTPAAEIDRAIQLNVESLVSLSQQCSKVMLTQRSGRIVNVSSINAVRGFRGLACYSATKAAVEGLTRSLAAELGPAGVLVNSIAPGFMDTDMTREMSREVRQRIIGRTPLGRLATTEEVAGTVAFLLSSAANAITGQSIAVDCGLSVV